MYLAVCTRPDMSYAVSYLSQFANYYDSMNDSLDGSKTRTEVFERHVGLRTTLQTNTFEADRLCRRRLDQLYRGQKIIHGIHLYLVKSAISWESRKQRTVALSSTEVEYMALSEAARGHVSTSLYGGVGLLGPRRLQRFLRQQRSAQIGGKPHISWEEQTHRRTSSFRPLREALLNGQLEIKYVPTDKMAADILTKAVPASKLRECSNVLDIRGDKDHPQLEGKC